MRPRFPPKKILVAVDLSDLSRDAWRLARRLARTLGSRLEAVHVSPSLSVAELGHPEALRAARRGALLRELERTYRGAEALHLLHGDVRLGVLRTTARRAADLLVVATAGRTGLRRLRESSVAEEVVRSARVPVLAVPGRAGPIRSVLAPVNLQPYSLAALRLADRVARALGARLSVVLVREGTQTREAAGSRLRAAVAELPPGLKTTVSVLEGLPLPVILKTASGHGLVVIASHRKGVLHDAVLGSTAEQTLRRAGVPVLCVPGAPETGGRAGAGRRSARGARRAGARRRAVRLSPGS